MSSSRNKETPNSANTAVSTDTREGQLAPGEVELICKGIKEGIIKLDSQWRLTYLNASAEQLFKTTYSEIAGKNLWTTFPELVSFFYKPIVSELKKPSQQEVTGYYAPQDVILSIRAIMLDENIVLYIENITEHTISLQTHDQHQKLLDGVMQNILDGIITINAKGEMLTVNPAVARMTGYRADELLGRNISMLMDDQHASKHDGYLKDFINAGEYNVINTKRYLHVRRKDGGLFQIELSITKMQLGDEPIFIGSIYDVTEKVEQQKKILELARFPEETWNPVLKISEQGVISYTNTRCGPILESWQTTLQGKVPDEILTRIQKSIAIEQSEHIEVECANGQYFKLLMAPVADLNAVYVYGLDITQSKKDRKELLDHRNMLEKMVRERTNEAVAAREQAERASQAKSLFLANMSHEIRTPLSSIIGYAESMLDDALTEKERTKSLETIIRSSHHLKKIINDILDLSKIEAEMIELENLDVNLFDMLSEIESLLLSLSREKGIDFNIEYQMPVPKMIKADPVRLKQIILNLCSNAIKFTEQGMVDVTLYYDQASQQLILAVVDTGIGMTDSQIENIFQPFVQADSSTTRKYGGTGLGLCMSRHLTGLMGGTLEVESEFGKGSTFKLYLPVKDIRAEHLVDSIEETTTTPVQTNCDDGINLDGQVLLVEDTPEIQQLVAYYLRKTGLDVDIANNGEEGMEMALAKDYHAVLMDIQMPIMDGFMAVKLLRIRGYTKPIIAMTANAMQEDRQRCLAAGCDDYLAKPVQRQQLFNMLQKHINDGVSMKNEILMSSLLETDPDMVDMIKTFLDKFPDYLEQCRLALESENWEALKEILHVLKGMGGSYGYPAITDVAKQAEAELKAGDNSNAKALLEKLVQLNEAAQQGYQQQTG